MSNEENNERQPADRMTEAEANAVRILLNEDIAKYELAKKQALAQISILDIRIAEAKLSLADVIRRENGVTMPEEPEQPAPEQPEQPAPEQPEQPAPEAEESK